MVVATRIVWARAAKWPTFLEIVLKEGLCERSIARKTDNPPLHKVGICASGRGVGGSRGTFLVSTPCVVGIFGPSSHWELCRPQMRKSVNKPKRGGPKNNR